MSCKGKTEPRQNAGRYPTSIALRFYIWIAGTKVCFCALSAARRQRPAMRPGTRCPPAPPRPIPPAISRPAAGIFCAEHPARCQQPDGAAATSTGISSMAILDRASLFLMVMPIPPHHSCFDYITKCRRSVKQRLNESPNRLFRTETRKMHSAIGVESWKTEPFSLHGKADREYPLSAFDSG